MDKLTKEEKEEGLVIVKCTNCDVSLMSHRDLMNLSIGINRVFNTPNWLKLFLK